MAKSKDSKVRSYASPENDMLKYNNVKGVQRKATNDMVSDLVLENHLRQIGNNREIAKKSQKIKKEQ